jgi:Planctomycete cytochrome C.
VTKLFCMTSFVVCVVACTANGGSDEQQKDVCLDPQRIDLTCIPTYEPTYDNLYSNLFSQSCGGSGSPCHWAGSPSPKAGLALTDKEMAYRYLLGEVDGRARVLPGNPACSVLVERIDSTDVQRVMPAGMPLPSGVRCAVRKWVAAGAAR